MTNRPELLSRTALLSMRRAIKLVRKMEFALGSQVVFRDDWMFWY